eukprot:m.421200 g.421200  ORF g.421200 m.421200 type:complete len:723 (-) comp33615_c0_seq1:10-2178(-)
MAAFEWEMDITKKVTTKLLFLASSNEVTKVSVQMVDRIGKVVVSEDEQAIDLECIASSPNLARELQELVYCHVSDMGSDLCMCYRSDSMALYSERIPYAAASLMTLERWQNEKWTEIYLRGERLVLSVRLFYPDTCRDEEIQGTHGSELAELAESESELAGSIASEQDDISEQSLCIDDEMSAVLIDDDSEAEHPIRSEAGSENGIASQPIKHPPQRSTASKPGRRKVKPIVGSDRRMRQSQRAARTAASFEEHDARETSSQRLRRSTRHTSQPASVAVARSTGFTDDESNDSDGSDTHCNVAAAAAVQQSTRKASSQHPRRSPRTSQKASVAVRICDVTPSDDSDDSDSQARSTRQRRGVAAAASVDPSDEDSDSSVLPPHAVNRAAAPHGAGAVDAEPQAALARRAGKRPRVASPASKAAHMGFAQHERFIPEDEVSYALLQPSDQPPFDELRAELNARPLVQRMAHLSIPTNKRDKAAMVEKRETRGQNPESDEEGIPTKMCAGQVAASPRSKRTIEESSNETDDVTLKPKPTPKPSKRRKRASPIPAAAAAAAVDADDGSNGDGVFSVVKTRSGREYGGNSTCVPTDCKNDPSKIPKIPPKATTNRSRGSSERALRSQGSLKRGRHGGVEQTGSLRQKNAETQPRESMTSQSSRSRGAVAAATMAAAAAVTVDPDRRRTTEVLGTADDIVGVVDNSLYAAFFRRMSGYTGFASYFGGK